jgi:alanine dehydrogenase
MTTVGVLAEVKDGERRVALGPSGVAMLTGNGLQVVVEQSVGVEFGTRV